MREIIIANNNKNKIIAILQEGKLKELYEENDEIARLEGNIYCGIVKDILPGMQVAFVDIGKEKNTFLHIKDLIPKVSNTTGNKQEDFKKYNIKDYIKKDTSILVQVKKDETQAKGAKISTDINIPGRFVVILPKDKFITVSQKIEDDEERKRLIKIAKDVTKNEIGIIIRTSAEKKDENIIKEDIKNTLLKWKNIEQSFKNIKNNKPKELYKNDSIVQKILLDMLDIGIDKIYVNSKDDENEIKKIISNIDKDNDNTVIEYNENILNLYELEKQIEKTKQRKIWLKCGGFITIDKTEALTAIDVNSGKFTGKQSLEQTILKVNEEASIEIANQLRLRDIGGIIVIDYIDMHDAESRNKVLETLKNELKKDRSKTQIIEFTKLDLLEMTRKHMFSN